MAYAKLTTVEKVRGWLKSDSPTNDNLIGLLIESLSDQAGRYLNRDNLGSVEAYVENYPMPRSTPSMPGRLLLRHYPIVTLTAVLNAGSSVPIIADPMVASAAGVLVDGERVLVFIGSPAAAGSGLPLCQVRYTAGHEPNAIPPGLTQAMNQWVGEIVKSQGWIGYVSQGLAGQSTSFEQGRSWNMSKRTKEMLEPFRDRIPHMGVCG